jgi:hypothetical protein
VVVKSLNAATVHMETYNSLIMGSFNASTSLKLITTNTAIRANVGLSNDELTGITDVTISTSHG